MALPKLETPTYTLTLPSNDEEVKYRPFLVKEQKRIMMAQESKDDKQMIDAITQLISDCTFNTVNPKECPIFDAEYIFLQIRSKSVGETIKLNITCPDDKKTTVEKEIKIDDIKVSVFDDHTNEVKVTDDVKMIFDYPLLSSYVLYNKTDTTQMAFTVVNDCVREIHFGEDVHNIKDITKKELTDFVDSLSTEQFDKVMGFFNGMPKLRYIVEVENPKTKVKSEVKLEGLGSFLV